MDAGVILTDVIKDIIRLMMSYQGAAMDGLFLRMYVLNTICILNRVAGALREMISLGVFVVFTTFFI